MLVKYTGRTSGTNLIVNSGKVVLKTGVEFEVTESELKLLAYLGLEPVKQNSKAVKEDVVETSIEEVFESEPAEIFEEKPKKKKK